MTPRGVRTTFLAVPSGTQEWPPLSACVRELRRLEAPEKLALYASQLTQGLNEVAASYGRLFHVSGPPQIPYLRLGGDEDVILHQRFSAECTRRGGVLRRGS